MPDPEQGSGSDGRVEGREQVVVVSEQEEPRRAAVCMALWHGSGCEPDCDLGHVTTSLYHSFPIHKPETITIASTS